MSEAVSTYGVFFFFFSSSFRKCAERPHHCYAVAGRRAGASSGEAAAAGNNGCGHVIISPPPTPPLPFTFFLFRMASGAFRYSTNAAEDEESQMTIRKNNLCVAKIVDSSQ